MLFRSIVAAAALVGMVSASPIVERSVDCTGTRGDNGAGNCDRLSCSTSPYCRSVGRQDSYCDTNFNVCFTPSNSGSATGFCNNDSECGTGLVCLNQACQSPPARAYKPAVSGSETCNTVADCERGTNANCIRTKIGGVVQSYCAYRTCASTKDGFFTINDSQLNNRYTNCAEVGEGESA